VREGKFRRGLFQRRLPGFYAFDLDSLSNVSLSFYTICLEFHFGWEFNSQQPSKTFICFNILRFNIWRSLISLHA
jgi:hypothetical protein